MRAPVRAGRIVALVSMFAAAPFSMTGTAIAIADGGSELAPSPLATLPFESEDEQVRSLWARGLALERDEDFIGSAQVYAEAVERAPKVAHLYWRIARNYLRGAARIPLAKEQERLEAFEAVASWAERGAAVDPECAECFLYHFAGLSRVATTRGIFSAARNAKKMSQLLERAKEL